MAKVLKLNGSLWQEEYEDGIQSTDLTIQQFDEIVTGAGLAVTAAVGPSWHIDSLGRHSFDGYDDLIDERDSVAYWIGEQIEAIAGAEYRVLMQRFSPEPVPPDNRFWTGIQLAVEIS